MDRGNFERLVFEAVQGLPPEFLERLDNVDIVVEDRPSSQQLRQSHTSKGDTLLGLYEGVPLTERGSYYGLVPPDKITIFQGPVQATCSDDWHVKEEVRRVVQHEIAHHFGIGDARLDEIEEENGWR